MPVGPTQQQLTEYAAMEAAANMSQAPVSGFPGPSVGSETPTTEAHLVDLDPIRRVPPVADLGEAKLRETRAYFGQVFDRSIAPGLKPEEIAAKRAAWMGDFDAALKADGVTLPEVDPAAERLAAEHGQPSPSRPLCPSDFNPSWQTKVSVEGMQSIKEWAVEMGFEPNFGRSFLEHLSALGPRVADMPAKSRELWASDQEALARKVVGGDAAYAQLIKDARSALDIARKHSSNLSDAIEANVFHDVHLLIQLAEHHRARVVYEKTRQS